VYKGHAPHPLSAAGTITYWAPGMLKWPNGTGKERSAGSNKSRRRAEELREKTVKERKGKKKKGRGKGTQPPKSWLDEGGRKGAPVISM